MKRSVIFGVPFLLFLFLFLPDRALGQQQQMATPPTVVISQANAKAMVTVTFSDRELQQVEGDPGFVLRKLGAVTARDCGSYPRRISSCIWACNGGKKIRTCNAILVRAFERLWPK